MEVILQVLQDSSQGSPAQEAALRLLARHRAFAAESLPRSFAALSGGDRNLLRGHFGASLPEFLALGAEGDAELFSKGLMQATARALRNRQAPWATLALQGLAQGEGAYATIPAALRDRAREEAEVLAGGGTFGRRMEYAAGRFFQEATEPSMILGMGVAGMAFSAVRLGALARLAARPASFWTRGVAARALASSAAFPAEVLGFWGTGRAVNAVLHPERLRWDGETLRHEFASQILTLGLLKLSGAAATRLFDRFHGISPLSGEAARLAGFTHFSRRAFHQLGMFGGIVAGHEAEVRLGLRPDGGHLWTDSLITLMHFNVGGRIAHTVMGPAHAARVRELEARTQRIGSPSEPRRNGWGPWASEAAAVTPLGLRLPLPAGGEARASIVMMSSQQGERGGGPRRAAGSAATPPPQGNQGAYKTILRTLLDAEIPVTERYPLSQMLYADLELARRIFDRLHASDLDGGQGRPAHDSLRNLDVFLHSLNRSHFETVSDALFEWHNRFRHLQEELRHQANVGGQKQRRHVRRLLDSVDLKFLETRRYLHDAESYLGDDKGIGNDRPGHSRSVFATNNYGRVIQRFLDINLRLVNYIQSKPDLERLFKDYHPRPIERRPRRVEAEEIEAALQSAGLEATMERRLRAALERGDYLLNIQEGIPLHRMLAHWSATSRHRATLQGRSSLERYLSVANELNLSLDADGWRRWREVHEELAGERLTSEELRGGLREILAPRLENPEAVLDRYFESARRMMRTIGRHRPEPRTPEAPAWSELRSQLGRLRDRGILAVDTYNGLLRWFESDQAGRSSRAIVNMREGAVAGLIDFLRKGSHSEAARREISQFLGEVVHRKDQGMLGILAIHFQNYQLGMMRDRHRIRREPSVDSLGEQLAVEAYDRFLEAMRATARFYSAHRELRGPYFEIFLKLEGGREDNNALLAAPVLHETRRLLDAGFQVDLLGRGGSGEAVLHASRPLGERRTVTVSSVLEPLASRAQLEHWLARAERELLHNGDFQRRNNGQENLVLSLQIPRIRSGVSKREHLQLWARDFLEDRPHIAEIQLVVPEKDNSVLNPLDATFFHACRITRDLPTTERTIHARVADLADPERPWPAFSNLIQLRRRWTAYLLERDADLVPILRSPEGLGSLETRVRELETALEAQRRAAEREIDTQETPQILGRIENQEGRLRRTRDSLAAGRKIEGLFEDNWRMLQEIAPRFRDERGFQNTVRELWGERHALWAQWGWNDLSAEGRAGERGDPYPSLAQRVAWLNEAAETMYGITIPERLFPNLLNLDAVGYRVASLHWEFRDRRLSLEGDLIPPRTLFSNVEGETEVRGEPDVGSFAISFGRERKGGRQQLFFDRLILPPHLREKGVGTLYFSELVRLSRLLGLDTIESPDTSGDHRYTMAVYGMRFKSAEERRRMLVPFEAFLHSYLMKIPELSRFDTSALRDIRTPRDLAHAHFDPGVGGLVLDPWVPGGGAGRGPQEIPNYYRVGRLFLLSDSRSYHGVFELKPGYYSMAAFQEYVKRRFPHVSFSAGDEN